MEESEIAFEFENALQHADTSKIRQCLISGFQANGVLKNRWEHLVEFAKDLEHTSPRYGMKKLIALRERIRLEKLVQGLIRMLALHQHATQLNLPQSGSNEQRSKEVYGIQKGSGTYYKTVAINNGKFYSIYDGITEYPIGKAVYKPFTDHKKSGIFVHKNVTQALQAVFPHDSALLYKRRVILKVKASGNVRLHGKKLAVEVVKPIGVVCELPRSKKAVVTTLALNSPVAVKYKALIRKNQY